MNAVSNKAEKEGNSRNVQDEKKPKKKWDWNVDTNYIGKAIRKIYRDEKLLYRSTRS